MMELIDYKKIKLEDTGVYEPGKHSFCHLFENDKITTVGQVLDDNLMKRLYYHAGEYPRYESELDGFRNLLKYKYLGITMNNDSFLGTTITDSDVFYYPYEDKFYSKLGISYDKIQKLNSLFKELLQKNKKVVLLDILKEIVSNEKWKIKDPVLYNVSKLNINSYNKSKNYINDEYDTILQLRGRLFDLIDERNKLDAKIRDLQQEFDEIVKNNAKGGVSK